MSQEQLLQVIFTIAGWAEKQDNLQCLWAYGSRVKGNARPESDLDLAFKLFPPLVAGEKVVFENHTLPLWKAELQQLSPWQVHLEPWAGSGTDVAGFVAEANILIYEAT